MVGSYDVPVFMVLSRLIEAWGSQEVRRQLGKGNAAGDPKRRRLISPLPLGLTALRREDRLLPQPQPWLPDWALRCPPTGVSTQASLGPGPCPQHSPPPPRLLSIPPAPHRARHLHCLPRRHPRHSNNKTFKGQEPPPVRARGSARVRARRAENAPQSQRTEISLVRAHAHLSAFRAHGDQMPPH